MKVFSQRKRIRRKRRDKRNFYRGTIICILFSLINLIWDIAFDPPKTIIPILLGIIVPILYAIFYFFSKRISYFYRIKYKAHYVTPVMCIAFGLLWFMLVSTFSGLGTLVTSTNLNTSKKNPKSAPSIVIPTTSTSPTINIASVGTDYIKSLFLYNSDLCKISKTPALIIKTKCTDTRRTILSKSTCDAFSRSTLNYSLVFLFLILAQILVVYLSEKVLYPLLKNKINPSIIKEPKQANVVPN